MHVVRLIPVLIVLALTGCGGAYSTHAPGPSQNALALELHPESEDAYVGTWHGNPDLAKSVTSFYTVRQYEDSRIRYGHGHLHGDRLVQTDTGYFITSQLGSITLTAGSGPSPIRQYEVRAADHLAQRYPSITGRPTARQLVDLIIADTDDSYLNALCQDGFVTNWETVAKLRRAGIDASFLHAMRRSRSTPVPAMQVVQGKVVPAPVPAPGDLAEPFTIDEIIYLKHRGVKADFIESMQLAGYRFSAERLTYLQQRGIDAPYAKSWREIGYDLSAEDLHYLKIRGVEASFAKPMIESGFQPQPEALVYLKIRGIDGAYVKSWRDAGYDLSPEQLSYLKNRGVTPTYGQAFRAAGYDFSPEQLSYLKNRGISAEYAASLALSGLEPLTPEQLYKLKSHGLSAEEVNRLRTPASQ